MPIPLRGGYSTLHPRLDRLPSATSEHIDRYPLTAATAPDEPTPVAAGFNWYDDFDYPQRIKVNGRTRLCIGAGTYLGRIRGGHATALRPPTVTDAAGWWDYYDQGVEGRCVEFATLRVLTLLNRKRYDITSRWHYWQAQRADEWEGGSYPGARPYYEGTSVRAGLDVLRRYGAIPALRNGRPIPAAVDPQGLADTSEGIAAYRWARSWDDVREVLGVPDDLPGVPMLNSWGRDYPREVLLMDAAGERLLREDGEYGVVTDR